MAANLAEQSLARGGLSAADEALARALLREATRRSRISAFSGSVSVGLRGQTNPSYLTNAPRIFSGGALVARGADRSPSGDRDGFVTLNLEHEYDLQQPYALSVLTRGLFHVSDYTNSPDTVTAGNLRPYDLSIADISSGLQFQAVKDRLSLRPHLIAARVWTQGQDLYSNLGLGVDGRYSFSDNLVLDFAANSLRRRFERRADIPNPSLLDGRQDLVRASVFYNLGGGHAVGLNANWLQYRAGLRAYANKATTLGGFYTVGYTNPLGGTGAWSTTVSGNWTERRYSAPDAGVIAGVARRDRESRYSLTQSMALSDDWRVQFIGERARNRANLPNYEYSNTSLTAALVRSF
jgi:hypothetical protein